jgi:hypothetical protein
MQSFRTIVELPQQDFSINHEHKILMLGSCFTENIGSRLKELKFNVDLNPFGVIFNPISVANSLKRLITADPIIDNEVFYYNECWNSFFFHSRFSHPQKEQCLQLMNTSLQKSSDFLKRTNYLFLTFGTAWVYYNSYTNLPVANCHKLPSDDFERRLLSISEIVKTYTELIIELKNINPELKIILTISPVRHLKDGASGNQVSKSVLVVAVNEICNAGLANYFPAFEILLDDLRDYRFYDNDMVHPNELAVDYIFEKFSDNYFNSATLNLNKKIKKIIDSCRHKPINPDSKAFKSFKISNINKINELITVCPYLDFSNEMMQLIN